jgi:hypothetical protein
MTVYSAPDAAERPAGGVGAGAASVFGRLTPDLRRDPREELRNMSLRDDTRAIVQKRIPAGAILADGSAPDPYDDSPDPVKRTFTLLKAGNREVVLLQIPEWIADDGRYVGALDETRYAFRGKVVRIIAKNVNAPSLGLDNLIDNWKNLEKIDTDFVAWRYVQEMSEGRHTLGRVLRINGELAGGEAGAATPRPSPAASKPRVFVSYAHDDVKWHDKLMKQLASIRDAYGQAIWSDHELAAGDDWMAGIVDALTSSQVVILLVSPAFLASPFIKAHEFGVALDEAKRGNKKLLWVYVTTCPFEVVGIGSYQAAHDIERALDQLPDGDAWAQLKKVHDSLAAVLAKLVA